MPAGQQEERPRAPRHAGWWAVLLVAAIAIGLAAWIPSPYALERPGPVVNALGTAPDASSEEDVAVIQVTGLPTYDTSGELNIVSVTVTGTPERPVSWLALTRTWFDPTQAVVPLSWLFPEGITADERAEINGRLMAESQESAIAASFRHLQLEEPHPGDGIDVELRLDEIGGPSAGLTFALALIDVLTPGDLTAGREIAATGTIDADGRVGPIGGVPQKVWGAAFADTEIFLLPVANCADLPPTLPDDLRVVAVATLTEALEALDEEFAAAADGGVSGCPVR